MSASAFFASMGRTLGKETDCICGMCPPKQDPKASKAEEDNAAGKLLSTMLEVSTPRVLPTELQAVQKLKREYLELEKRLDTTSKEYLDQLEKKERELQKRAQEYMQEIRDGYKSKKATLQSKIADLAAMETLHEAKELLNAAASKKKDSAAASSSSSSFAGMAAGLKKAFQNPETKKAESSTTTKVPPSEDDSSSSSDSDSDDEELIAAVVKRMKAEKKAKKASKKLKEAKKAVKAAEKKTKEADKKSVSSSAVTVEDGSSSSSEDDDDASSGGWRLPAEPVSRAAIKKKTQEKRAVAADYDFPPLYSNNRGRAMSPPASDPEADASGDDESCKKPAAFTIVGKKQKEASSAAQTPEELFETLKETAAEMMKTLDVKLSPASASEAGALGDDESRKKMEQEIPPEDDFVTILEKKQLVPDVNEPQQKL